MKGKMKVGLLECDHVGKEFQHHAGDYRHMFARLLPGLNLISYDVCNGHFPASIQECDAFICTGSRYSVYDDIGWIHRLKGLVREIKEAGKPFLGICFGHQMMAEALGGKVRKAQKGWCIGVHTFHRLHEESWMGSTPGEFRLMMLCQDQVEKLPPDSKVLASAADCPVGAFKVGNTMLGIQAHPEFIKPYLQAIIQSREERIGTDKARAGIESLGQPVDTEIIADWMIQFLENSPPPSS